MTEAIERAARALIDLTPTINGYHESHIAIMAPKVRAVLESLLPPSDEIVEAMQLARQKIVCAAQSEGRYPTSAELSAGSFTAAILCVLGRTE